mgnify:CR=1 FL=1
MPVTHGVTGSSPVRTAKGSNSSYSLFLLCIQTAKVSDGYHGYSSLKVTYSVHLSCRSCDSSLLWGAVLSDVYFMGCFALLSMTKGISRCPPELPPPAVILSNAKDPVAAAAT